MKKLFLLAVISASVTLLGCAKKGCTDVNADNYYDKAKKDDGSCQYSGNAVFWYGKQVSDSLLYYGVSSITIYVNGKVAGSQAASMYWSSAPDCGQNSSITYTADLGGVNTQSYNYSVKDDTGYEIWSGVININANSCSAYELTW